MAQFYKVTATVGDPQKVRVTLPLVGPQGPAGEAGPAGTTDYTQLENVPATFAPAAHSSTHATGGSDALAPSDIGAANSAHTHIAANVTDFNTAASAAAPVQSVAGKTGTVTLGAADVSGVVSDTDARLSDARTPTAHTHTLSEITDAGTAAAAAATDFATSAQGALADTSVQPADLATVATSGNYDDLSGKPTLGTAAASDASDFATSAQGTLAGTAVQPGDLATVASTGSYADLTNVPSTFPPSAHTHVAADVTDFSTAAASAAPVQSVAGRTGTVTLAKADVGLSNVDNTSDLSKPISTAAQTALDGKAALSHTHTASQVTDFNTAAAAAAPVQSVNGNTGSVTVAVPAASTATPSALGTAAAGTSNDFARADHVHALPALPLAPIFKLKTSTTLYDTNDLVADPDLFFVAEANKNYAVTLFIFSPTDPASINFDAQITQTGDADIIGAWTKSAAVDAFQPTGALVTERSEIFFPDDIPSGWAQHFTVIGGNSNSTITLNIAADGEARIGAGSYLKAEIIP